MGVTQAQREALLEAAKDARRHAHAPYSGFAVGAAVLAEDGSIFSACNVEVSNYSGGCCAERIAVFKAVSSGYRRFIACAVVAEMEESPCGPCGACRQVLWDFGPDSEIIMSNPTGSLQASMPLSELIPLSFGPENVLDAIKAQHGSG